MIPDYLNRLREEEMRRVLAAESHQFKDKDILEIGSGTGVQLQMLKSIAKSAVGLELASSIYLAQKVCDIREYDGFNIPLDDCSCDVVFSSNVLEHIRHEKEIHGQIRRVLRPGGKAIHVVPSRAWRILTSVMHYPALPINKLRNGQNRSLSAGASTLTEHGVRWMRKFKRLVPDQHGEISSLIGEYREFGVSAWRKRFLRVGWKVERVQPLGMIYSGYCVLADRVSTDTRTKLAHVFGSSTVMFVLSPKF